MIFITRAIQFGIVCAALVACTTSQASWRYEEAQNHVGRIYYYERSNIDGSMDERITVFHRDNQKVEVYKENGLCRNAALVTAEMDWSVFSASKITGGQLQPDAQHMEFAFLDWDRENKNLNILVKLPDAEIRESAPIASVPWHLYDFDFASLTLATQHLASTISDFEFGMALVWTDPAAGDPLTWMGDVSAQYVSKEERLGADAYRYKLLGTALLGDRSTGKEGSLWLDAEDGHIVDAILPMPSHAGYTDLRLRLLKISDGGDEEWTKLLKAHFEGC